MHESGPKLIDDQAFLPAWFQRAIGVVKGGRGAIEKVQHRDVDLTVAIVAGGVDKRGDLIASGKDISAPQVPMQQGWRSQFRQPVREVCSESLDAAGKC